MSGLLKSATVGFFSFVFLGGGQGRILGIERIKDHRLSSFKCIRTCRVGSFAVLNAHLSFCVFQREFDHTGSKSFLNAMVTSWHGNEEVAT